MTPDQIACVQSSVTKVQPIADTAASLFYARLFETAPEVRPLFRGDMAEQGRKLMATLGAVVNGLNDLGGVLGAARALAVRHVGYGVKPEHYEPVGAALIWTLEQGLGAEFDRDTRDAWLAAYGALSSAMIIEAYSNAPAEMNRRNFA